MAMPANYFEQFDFPYAQRKRTGFRPKRRTNSIFPRKNRLCLPGIERDPKKWRFVLGELCANYNHLHAVRMKCISVATASARFAFYSDFFSFVCPKFKIDPREFGAHHVRAYFEAKTVELLSKSCEPEDIAKRYRDQLSYLDFFSRWIAKPGIVPKHADVLARLGRQIDYLKMPDHRALSLSGEEIEEKIALAFALDFKFGMQCFLMAFFGLRPRESIGIILSRCIHLNDTECFLEILLKRGSKGGRPRRIVADNESKKAALAFALQLSEITGVDALCWNGMDLQQAVRKQDLLLREKLKLAHGTFKGSAYQFRHGFASRFLRSIEASQRESALQTAILKDTAAQAVALNENHSKITAVAVLKESISTEPSAGEKRSAMETVSAETSLTSIGRTGTSRTGTSRTGTSRTGISRTGTSRIETSSNAEQKKYTDAKLEVSLNLGHFRSQVTVNYLGATGRVGSDLIGSMIRTILAERGNASGYKFCARFLLKEMACLDLTLWLSLVFWMLRKESGKDLSLLKMMRKLFVRSNRPLEDFTGLVEKLSGFVSRDEAMRFLDDFADRLDYDWLEKEVLNPVLNNYFFG